jgi:hypothetical protein
MSTAGAVSVGSGPAAGDAAAAVFDCVGVPGAALGLGGTEKKADAVDYGTLG